MDTPRLPQPAQPLVRPMVRVGLRDLVPVAWRVAQEFARPTRASRSWWPAAILLMPLTVVMVGNGHTYHWQRRAVLGLRPAGNRHVPRTLAVAALTFGAVAWAGGVMLDRLGIRGDEAASWAAAGALGVSVAAFLLVRLVTVLAGGHVDPLPRVEGPTTAQWVGDLAAAAPGTDAIRTVFEPHLRATVPAGQVVTLLAATERLAHRYAEVGFARTTAKRRRLYATA